MLGHMAGHMKGYGCGLSYLCDWAMFLKDSAKHQKVKEWMNQELKEVGLRKYALLLTECCVDYLGLKPPEWKESCKEGLSYELFRELYDSGNSGRKRKKVTSPLNFTAGSSGKWVLFEKSKNLSLSRIWNYGKEIVKGNDNYRGLKEWFQFVCHNKKLYDEIRLFVQEED